MNWMCSYFSYSSTSRYADLEKPKKKKTLSATTSLVSIPNTIKLSMLNSGLLSFGEYCSYLQIELSSHTFRNIVYYFFILPYQFESRQLLRLIIAIIIQTSLTFIRWMNLSKTYARKN